MSRNRINALLLLLVAGLSVLVWLSGRDTLQTQAMPLTQLLPDQINSISISNQSGPAFSMQREENGWRMIEPYAIEANEIRIQRLLEIAITPVRTQFKAEQGKLAEFGLAPPVVRLSLDQLEIQIGGTEPINHYRYIGIGEKLYLIKDLFPHLLQASAETFISTRILPYDSDLALIRTPNWQLARSSIGPQVWKLEPAVNGISMDLLTAKVDEWKNARALRVIRAPDDSIDTRLEFRINGSDDPLSFGVLRQQQGTLLIREELGLAYDLPRIDSLLSAPAGETKEP